MKARKSWYWATVLLLFLMSSVIQGLIVPSTPLQRALTWTGKMDEASVPPYL